MPDFPRFLTIEEAAQLLGVSVARISLWIGECKLPVAARSEYAGFLLRTLTVQTIGCVLANALSPEARTESPDDVPIRVNRTRGQLARLELAVSVEPNQPPLST
jgi:hypothetical protein